MGGYYFKINRPGVYLFLFLVFLNWNGCAPSHPFSKKTRVKKNPSLDYTLQVDVVTSGFDGVSCWFHPRAGAIPGPVPTVVMTMQKWLVKRSDVFFPLWGTRTHDFGKSWTEIEEHREALGRRSEPDLVEVGISDFTPKWNYACGKLLGTGHTVRYRDNHLMQGSSRQTIFSVYDTATHSWSRWEAMKMPDDPKFHNAGAGSTQRVDLPNGEILLPIYYKSRDANEFSSTVVRCIFNGKELIYAEHGNQLTLTSGRGFVEPSLTFFKDRYFLTLRNDDSGYVAKSRDGLHFDQPKMWRFDDGENLGNYNTQQHWVTHSDGLFLVYTRKGADNDHVIRHRAPLFIAQVDPERLVILRETEKVLIPNNGAQLGNFGVVNVNEKETWITTSEGMSHDAEEYGANGRVYAARVLWNLPNRIWNK